MDATRVRNGSVNGCSSHEFLRVEQVLCRHWILGDFGFKSCRKSQLQQRMLIFGRLVHLQPIVFFAKHVGWSEELILLWWPRCTQWCIHDLVCSHNSLSNLQTPAPPTPPPRLISIVWSILVNRRVKAVGWSRVRGGRITVLSITLWLPSMSRVLWQNTYVSVML